jgi:cytochrome c oxidase cbb3-type subunit IV
MNFTALSMFVTIISMIIFLGIVYWAYAAQNKDKFEAIGKSLLEIDSDTTEK